MVGANPYSAKVCCYAVLAAMAALLPWLLLLAAMLAALTGMLGLLTGLLLPGFLLTTLLAALVWVILLLLVAHGKAPLKGPCPLNNARRTLHVPGDDRSPRSYSRRDRSPWPKDCVKFQRLPLNGWGIRRPVREERSASTGN